MKNWPVVSVAVIAVLFIVLGSVFTVRDNRKQAEIDANMRSNDEIRTAYQSMRVASVKERAAATNVIKTQLTAFKKRDFAAAIKMQSAAMRSHFASPGEFGKMMLGSYPDFCNYKSVEFGRGRIGTDKSVWMRVSLQTASGNELRSMYQLVHENGVLRISGVSVGLPDANARHGSPFPPRSRMPRHSPQQNPVGA